MGEYPGGNITENGEKITGATLVIDREAYDRILADFSRQRAQRGFHGILVDREHFSLDLGKQSDAMAWAKAIREDADGLWTQWEFTPPGKEAWENKVLVSRSPVMTLEHLGGKRFRPIALESVAMTNTPHFDLSVIAARAADGQTQQGDNTMKKLLAMLGLAEDATEDQACEAAQALIDAAAQAQTAAQEAQTAARKSRCDAFITANRGAIKDETAFRAAYVKDPDLAEATIAACKTVATPPPDKRIDASSAAKGKPAAPTAAARRKAQNEAISAYRSANRSASFAQAFAACSAADPGTFTDGEQG